MSHSTLNATLAQLRHLFATPATPASWDHIHRLLNNPSNARAVLDYARDHIDRWWSPADAARPDVAWTWRRGQTLALITPDDPFIALRDMLTAWRLDAPLTARDGLAPDEIARIRAQLGAPWSPCFEAYLREAGHLTPQTEPDAPIFHYTALASTTPARANDALAQAQAIGAPLGWVTDASQHPTAPVAFAYNAQEELVFALDRSTSPPTLVWASEDTLATSTGASLDALARYAVAWSIAIDYDEGETLELPPYTLAPPFVHPIATLDHLPDQPSLSVHAVAQLDALMIAVVPTRDASLGPGMPSGIAEANLALRRSPEHDPQTPKPWWLGGALPPDPGAL